MRHSETCWVWTGTEREEDLNEPKGKRPKVKSAKTKERIKTGGIVAAFIAALSVFAVMLQTERNLLAQYEKATVYVAIKDIPKGVLITSENRGMYYGACEMEKNSIPGAAYLEANHLEDVMAVYDIEDGTLLSEGMFVEWDEITSDKEDICEVGLTVDDLSHIAGGVIRAGDRVDIFVVTEEGCAVLAKENVYVKSVFEQSGHRIAEGDRTLSSQRINIVMDASEVVPFYDLLSLGDLRVVKRL
jgi:hypothetical protein